MRKLVLFLLLQFTASIFWGQGQIGNLREYSVISREGLNFRQGPSFDSKVICKISFNEKVQSLDEPSMPTDTVGSHRFYPKEYNSYEMFIVGYWMRVKYNNLEGYLFSGYLRHQRYNFEHNDPDLNDDFGLTFVGTDCANNLHKDPVLNWYGIYKDSVGYILKEVQLHYYNDSGEATGFGISTENNKNLLFVFGNKMGKVIEGNISGKYWEYYESQLSTNNQFLPEVIEITSSSELILKQGNKRQILNNKYDYPQRLVWNGDLDGDNLDDYIFHLGSDKNFKSVLFLSSQADKDQIVKAVAMYYYGYCC